VYTAERFSPQRAEHLAQRIDRAVGRIVDAPMLGIIVPEFQRDTLREAWEKPFLIIYSIGPDVIANASIVDHARDLANVIGAEAIDR
jgi:plasmid stabilization system protein ParE